MVSEAMIMKKLNAHTIFGSPISASNRVLANTCAIVFHILILAGLGVLYITGVLLQEILSTLSNFLPLS